jgi:hypothetical protein
VINSPSPAKPEAMRDDLLDAKASVDWPVDQFQSLQVRLDSWVEANFEIVIKNQPPPATNDVVAAIQKAPLSREFNVEVGAYINAIRSSLDILVTALAYRYSIPQPNKAYFPVGRSLAEIDAGKSKGAKFVKALPTPERTRIEALKPYQGGNDLLWALHQLDILRKHRRLLGVVTNPGMFRISGWGVSRYFKPVATGWMFVNDQETVVGLLAHDSPSYEMKFSVYITLNEAGLSPPKPVVATLNEFASLANSIIQLFDTP